MGKIFNTEGCCNPEINYMVDLSARVEAIADMVDGEKYFTINRARQYGKTTTLSALADYLKQKYEVVSLDFQMMSSFVFESEQAFAAAFAEEILDTVREFPDGIEKKLKVFAEKTADTCSLQALFKVLKSWCLQAERNIVLIIDEVDTASNNQVFLDFLAQLRAYYLQRRRNKTFQSVILAGVYDIRNIKGKLHPDNAYKANSPWNIAADFDIDMDFSSGQIALMLEEYELDNHTGMSIQEISEEIYQYTSGYPVLVSSICKQLDEKLPGTDGFKTIHEAWTSEGIAEAVKRILKKSSPLFESMTKQLDLYKELRKMIEDIIYRGRQITYSPEQKSINLGVMFGFLKEVNGHVAIANRMFEMCLLNLFMAEESESDVYAQGGSDRIGFIRNHMLDMDLVLGKFVDYFTEICSQKDDKFIEKYGRKFFLIYLKPIINGTGNYYIEAQTRDERRTDVIVDYLGE